MERDFMGLNSKDSVFVVKEEVVEASCKDTVAGSSGLAWPFSSMVSALPHFMAVKCEQEEKPPKNFGGSTMKQQFRGGNALAASHSILHSTEQWINSQVTSGVPAQLTIFYAGTVNVFDGISPEKAQAIMFLAGTGCVGQSKVHVQGAAAKVVGGEQGLISGLPSPISVSSHPIDESANNDDVKTVGCLVKPQSQRMVSVAATAMISSDVPQARKASLARFLEKRKERVMNAAAPYNPGKKAGDFAAPDSSGGFSATSSVSTSKETSGGI